MTKAQIHFSNKGEVLTEALKKEVFSPRAKPFEKKLILVPHLALKAFLMENFAKDPKLQVAAGVQIDSLPMGWGRHAKKTVPSNIELSFFLQHALLSLIEKYEELKSYFDSRASEKRIGPFCDALASHFLSYGTFGKGKLRNWQEELWREVKKVFSFPIDKLSFKGKYQVHLFGFSFLPKSYFSFFEQCDAHFYLFSPCAVFWGDFISKREQKKLQIDFLEEEQNPLLANWGKVGREMQGIVDDVPAQELYVQVEEKCTLHRLHNQFLEGAYEELAGDDSIRCIQATTPFREVEILRDHLFVLFESGAYAPKDVQVFAPDISKYAPYIEATFAGVDYTISDLSLKEVDPIARAMLQLISLQKNHFAVDEVLELFAKPPFREKFDLNTSLLRSWLEEANVHSGQKTWDRGLKRLVLGLGQVDGAALPIVSVTETDELEKLVVLVDSLMDDLSVFEDGTRWTISTWLRYFVCLLESYFVIDGGHYLIQQLMRVAARSDHLDQEEVPFSGVERILHQLVGRKGKTEGAGHLQTIRFASLSEGCGYPSKVICLLGMEEGAFPRGEESSSLAGSEQLYKPKRSDADRYLFLELLSHARQHFWMSYCSQTPNELVEDLLLRIQKEVEKGEKTPVPEDVSPKPLIPSFYSLQALPKTELDEPRVIDIQKLFKFARHPLRYYFHEVLKIYPDFGRETKEFVLDPLTKYKLVREAFEKPLEEVVDLAKKRGDISETLLESFSIEQLENEVALYKEFPKKIAIEPIKVRGVTLIGKLENFTNRGLLVKGKNSLEDRIRFWPQALIAKEMGLPLVFLKDDKEGSVEGSLEDFVEYFLLAHKTPSPFLPQLARAFLNGTPHDLKKGLQRVEDEVLGFLFFRDPFPNVEALHKNWSSHLKGVFGGAFAKV